MKKQSKHIFRFVIYFLIFFWISYNFSPIKIDKNSRIINFIQLLFLLAICLGSRGLLELLLENKKRIIIRRIIKVTPLWSYSGKILNLKRCFFIAIKEDGKEVVTSKLIRNNELSERVKLNVYYGMRNKLRVVDKYVIWHDIVITILLVLFYIIIIWVIYIVSH